MQEFAPDSFRDQDAVEESRQDLHLSNEDEAVERRGVAYDDHRGDSRSLSDRDFQSASKSSTE